MKDKSSIRTNLQLVLTLVAVSSVILTAIGFTYLNWQKLWNMASQKQTYFTEYTGAKIESWFDDHLRKMLFVSQINDLVHQNPDYRKNLLNSIIESNSALTDVMVLDSRQNLIDAQNNAFDPKYEYVVDPEKCESVLRSGMEHIDLCSISRDKPLLSLIYPLRDSSGRINGLLKARLNLQYLDYLISKQSFGYSGYAYLQNAQNRVIVQNAFSDDVYHSGINSPKTYLNLLRTDKDAEVYTGLKGTRVVGTAVNIPQINWFLIVEYPIIEMLHNMSGHLIWLVLLGGLSTAIALLFGHYLYRKIATRLSSLLEAATEISKGNFGHKTRISGDDELSEVADAFNAMSHKLDKMFYEESQKLRFEKVFSQITGVILSKGQHDIDSIQLIQKLCAEYMGASRSVVYLYNAADDSFTGRYEWYKHGYSNRVNPSRMSYPASVFPITIPLLKHNIAVCMGLEDADTPIGKMFPEYYGFADPMLPCGETPLFQYFKNNNLAYMIGLPIFDGDTFLGKVSFGFDDHPADIELWKDYHLNILKNVISSSLLYFKQRSYIEAERERLHTTLLSIGDAVIVTDVMGSVTLMNQIAVDICGKSLDEALNANIDDLITILDAKTLHKLPNPAIMALENRTRYELPDKAILKTESGLQYNISDSAAPIFDKHGNLSGAVLVFRDETEKIEREREQDKMQRLEAVSLLAAGIAHDFNNLLTAILGNLSLAKDLIPASSEAAEILRAAESSADKGRDIIKQLMIYVKGGTLEVKHSNIVGLMTETAKFMLKSSGIELKTEIQKDLKDVVMSEGIFNQIFGNVLLNAKQAAGTYICICAENMEIADNHKLPLKPGSYVKICIEDNGQGIAPDIIDRIFDPYFTTKNCGTGLGLSSTLSLLKKHNGFISVSSKPAEGTTVVLYIPAAESVSIDISPEIQKKKERILVYEHDESLHLMLKRSLEVLDYEIVITTGWVDLMEWYKISQTSENPFWATFIDADNASHEFVYTTIRELLDIDDSQRIVIARNSVDKSNATALKEAGVHEVLEKPFHINRLRAVFRK